LPIKGQLKVIFTSKIVFYELKTTCQNLLVSYYTSVD